jgi:hypothetical protein
MGESARGLSPGIPKSGLPSGWVLIGPSPVGVASFILVVTKQPCRQKPQISQMTQISEPNL